MNLENEILSLFPAYDPDWPEVKRMIWMMDFAQLIRIFSGGETPESPQSAERKPRKPRTKLAKIIASSAAHKGGRPPGVEMCPGCHKMIKPADLTITVNERHYHTDCAHGE